MQDTRILQQHGYLSVLSERHEVMFRDGSTVGLHPVAACGTVQMFLRAVRGDHLHAAKWYVFDLRHLHTGIEADMLRLPARDAPGLVFYVLRSLWGSAACFREEASQRAHAAWADEPQAAAEQAAA
jgi:hypothetical protein